MEVAVASRITIIITCQLLLATAMTIPRRNLRISTVGNLAKLGGLFNYNTNQILPKDYLFWSREDIAQLTTINIQHRSVFIPNMANDIEDFTMNLELHSTEILDWQLGLVQPKGSMVLLKELYTPIERDITGYVVYQTAQHLHPGIAHRQINRKLLFQSGANADQQMTSNSYPGADATHVVTSLYTGIREFLACDRRKPIVANSSGTRRSNLAQTQHSFPDDLFNPSPADLDGGIQNRNCILYSDLAGNQSPTQVNATDALLAMKENYLMARNFSTPDVTDAMELTPISYFHKNFSKSVTPNIPMDFRLVHNLSQSLLNLELALLKKIQPELEEKESRLFFADFTAYLDDCKKRIAFIIPRIRSGQLPSTILNSIIKSCRKSQFEANFMRRFAVTAKYE